jgi:hypothetical protein
MDQGRHDEGMIVFLLVVGLILSGPLSLLLHERPDADNRPPHRAWL